MGGVPRRQLWSKNISIFVTIHLCGGVNVRRINHVRVPTHLARTARATVRAVERRIADRVAFVGSLRAGQMR